MAPHPDMPEFASIIINPSGQQSHEPHPHGRQVASIAFGKSSLTPGLSPGASLLNVQIADDQGVSNSVYLAQGIVQAVDAGANIINISMGSYQYSPLVHSAVEYATQQGVVIFAPSGNDGDQALAYPAAYQDVYAVGAIDANGRHVAFSNYHPHLDVSAPGYQINTIGENGDYVISSGTSFSNITMAAGVAILLSEDPNLTPHQATDILLNNLNDAGAPGHDPFYGTGHLDIGRALRSSTPNITDAAVTAHHLVANEEPNVSDQVVITVQNQGTKDLGATKIDIQVNQSPYGFTSQFLPEGATQSFPIDIDLNSITSSNPLEIHTVISSGQEDIDHTNNELKTRISLPQQP